MTFSCYWYLRSIGFFLSLSFAGKQESELFFGSAFLFFSFCHCGLDAGNRFLQSTYEMGAEPLPTMPPSSNVNLTTHRDMSSSSSSSYSPAPPPHDFRSKQLFPDSNHSPATPMLAPPTS